MEKQSYTPREAGVYLNLPYNAVLTEIASGRLKAVPYGPTGKRKRVSKNAMDAWLAGERG